MIAANPAPAAELTRYPQRTRGSAVPDVDPAAVLLRARGVHAVHHPTAVAPAVPFAVDDVPRRLAKHDGIARSVGNVGDARAAVLAEHVSLFRPQRLPEIANDAAIGAKIVVDSGSPQTAPNLDGIKRRIHRQKGLIGI